MMTTKLSIFLELTVLTILLMVTKKNDQNVTSVKHDPRRGIYDDSEDDSGLKLKGVNKEDLESLSYGNSLYED